MFADPRSLGTMDRVLQDLLGIHRIHRHVYSFAPNHSVSVTDPGIFECIFGKIELYVHLSSSMMVMQTIKLDKQILHSVLIIFICLL